MQKRSVLYIGNKLSKSGSTVTSIETLGAFLRQEGFRVRTASSLRNKYLRMLHMLWSTLRYSATIDKVLIDTYSTQNFLYAVAVAKLCRLLKLPYIPILRGGNLPERLKSSPSQCQKLFGLAAMNVAPSSYLMEAFKREGFTNLVYIPNTIDLSQYTFRLRKQIAPKLIWVRSFSSIYNPLLALQILQQLRSEGYNAELCMVGPEKDDSLKACKDFSEANNLNVTYTGLLPKQEWIALASDYDIFINTTNFDNTPVSVIEAMALGLVVVSTDVGGIPFLIEDKSDGMLVPPNDALVFSEAIKTLLATPHLVEKLSKNARRKAESFDWKSVKHSWIQLLNQ
ncbi:MAG: glycosyltransferase family 4 protein [Flavobacteriales bacterium]|jgi:glycosyltransferase involved in cell wall biosynthesis|nr:glycosyltransferase family 4 protein [Flavobacteriales bacterium]